MKRNIDLTFNRDFFTGRRVGDVTVAMNHHISTLSEEEYDTGFITGNKEQIKNKKRIYDLQVSYYGKDERVCECCGTRLVEDWNTVKVGQLCKRCSDSLEQFVNPHKNTEKLFLGEG